MKQANKKNTVEYNAFEDIEVAVRAETISASARTTILKGESAGCSL